MNFVKTCKYISIYTDCYLAESRNTKTVTHSMSGKNKLDMAAFLAANARGTRYFTKASIQSWAYKFFGSKPDVSVIPSMNSTKRKWICKTPSSSYRSEPYMFCGGDWGDYEPKYAIKKVMKSSYGYYVATVENRLGSWGTSKYKILGTTKIYIKKNSNSSLKFKVIKIVTTGTGRGY